MATTAKKSANLKADAGTATTTVKASKPGSAVALKKTVGGAVGAVGDVRDLLRQQAAAMNERTNPASGNKILVGQDKMFKLPNGDKVAELRGVIVEFTSVHAFYERPYDPKAIVPPGCFAVGTNPKDLTPVAESPNKQAETCQICPMNEFGSAGAGKACKNGRRLALLPTNDDGTDVDHEGDILVLDVSPTAIKGFDSYVQQLSRLHQLPPVAFITTIQCDPNTDYAKLMFSDPQPVTSLGEVMGRQDEARDMIGNAPDFTGWVPVNAPKGRAAPAGKVAAGARR